MKMVDWGTVKSPCLLRQKALDNITFQNCQNNMEDAHLHNSHTLLLTLTHSPFCWVIIYVALLSLIRL